MGPLEIFAYTLVLNLGKRKLLYSIQMLVVQLFLELMVDKYANFEWLYLKMNWHFELLCNFDTLAEQGGSAMMVKNFNLWMESI